MANLPDDLADLTAAIASRFPTPQDAWARGQRIPAPLSEGDTKRLRAKMRAAYAAWTGGDLETDLRRDRFPPQEAA